MSDNTLERVVQKEILDMLYRNNIYHFRKEQLANSKSGIPDVWAVFCGVPLGIEVKRPKGGRVSITQKNNHAHLLKSGGRVIIPTSVQDVIDVLEEIDPTFKDENKIEVPKNVLQIKKRK